MNAKVLSDEVNFILLMQKKKKKLCTYFLVFKIAFLIFLLGNTYILLPCNYSPSN